MPFSLSNLSLRSSEALIEFLDTGTSMDLPVALDWMTRVSSLERVGREGEKQGQGGEKKGFKESLNRRLQIRCFTPLVFSFPLK